MRLLLIVFMAALSLMVSANQVNDDTIEKDTMEKRSPQTDPTKCREHNVKCSGYKDCCDGLECTVDPETTEYGRCW